jgi:hypothetical protein
MPEKNISNPIVIKLKVTRKKISKNRFTPRASYWHGAPSRQLRARTTVTGVSSVEMYICKKKTPPPTALNEAREGKPSSREATAAARAPRLKRRQKPHCMGRRCVGIYLRPNLARVPFAPCARVLLHCPVDSQQQLLPSPNLQQS